MNKLIIERRRLLTAAGFVAVGTGVSAGANAELPAEATAAITTITGNVTDMNAAVWPVIASVVAAMILIKLFKRFSSKI
tara:strand:+ start:376 stop:612 length:237 start_codon:yes stop_codon:yes gene_type:complete